MGSPWLGPGLGGRLGVTFPPSRKDIFIALVYYAWPESASGPQALQHGWGGWLHSLSTWLASFAGRLTVGAVAIIVSIFAAPFAFSLGVFGVGKMCEWLFKMCEWLFDAFALVGRILYPLIEAGRQTHQRETRG